MGGNRVVILYCSLGRRSGSFRRCGSIGCGSGDEKVLGYGRFDVVAEVVADGVVNGEDLAVGEYVLVQRGIQY